MKNLIKIVSLHKETINTLASVITAISAIFALFGALYQIDVGRHEARMGVANTIYKDYLALAFQNPEFSSPSYPKDNPAYPRFEKVDEPSKSEYKFQKYEYFVAQLIFASELILERTENNEAWRNTLRDQLKNHALYLSDPMLSPDHHYTEELRSLSKEAIEEYKKSNN